MGRVIEPRNRGHSLKADAVTLSGRQQWRCRKPSASYKAGVEERGTFTPGFSEELGRPDGFHVERAGRSNRLNKLPARRKAAPADQGRLRRADTNTMRRSVVRE